MDDAKHVLPHGGGPKTDLGKAVSRYNAIKHGLLSQEVLLPGEDGRCLNNLCKRMRAELKPATEMEMILVDRISANSWRLKRALKIEHEMIVDDYMGQQDFLRGQKTMGKAFSYDFASYDTYGKFMRYETGIERGLYRALHELQRIQASRKGGSAPYPLAIDLDVSGNQSDEFV